MSRPHPRGSRPRAWRIRPADRRSRRQVDRAALLAGALHSDPDVAARLAREATARTHGRRSTEDDLLLAVGELAAQLPDADEARGRLLLVLVDLEHRRLGTVSPLLGLSPDRAQQLLELARHRTGTAPRGQTCRGWALVAGGGRLTTAERRAGEGHLRLCRHCRERLIAVGRVRRELLSTAAGTAVLMGGAAAGASGTAVAGGALVAGKALTATVAGLGAAVAVAGGIAVSSLSSTSTPPRPPVAPTPVGEVVGPAPATSGVPATPDCTSRCVATSPVPEPLPHPAGSPEVSSAPTGAEQEPVPSLPVPSLPVPSLPVPSLPLPDLPLPSVSVPPTLLPTLPATPLTSPLPLLPPS